MFYNLRYKIAELLFSDILDDDFALGTENGVEGTKSQFRVRSQFARTRYAAKATKVRMEGYDAAIKDFNDILEGIYR
jgi:hypothetical protein